MPKIAVVTDTHFGARNDSLPMQRSMQKFIEKVFFPTLEQHEVTRVLHGGDYVDRRKYVNFQTAQWIREVYRGGLIRRNITEDVICGNHDIFYRSSTELNAVGELYERYDYHNVRSYMEPAEIDVAGCGILMLPWITDNNRGAAEKALSTTSCSIVLGHLEINGFQMFRGMPHIGGYLAEQFDRFELVMSGHFHHKSEAGPIHYLGAPYPMIWSDYRDPRGFHLFDTDTKELTFVENPYGIFMRIEYDDANQKHDYIKELVHGILQKDSPYQDAYVKVIVKSKNQPYWFDLMMDALYKVNAQDIVVVDDILVNDHEDGVYQETPDVDTLTLMKEYVDSLSISCDRDALFAYLASKYRESIAQSQSVRA